jgi:butyrate kinase
MKILAINPGSTSTKLAVYEDGRELFRACAEHSSLELARFTTIASQYPLRLATVLKALKDGGIEVRDLDGVVGRGGLLPPMPSGACRVNEAMIDRLANRPVVEHASNLGALLAFHLAEPQGIPTFIYDPVTVDELDEIARITGLADVRRGSFSHALNMRAAAIRCAHELERPVAELNLIVAHLGGGHSISVHRQGRMVDIVSDDEGPFSPERAGRLPGKELVRIAAGSEAKAVNRRLRNEGGLKSLVGTNDAREIERRIAAGDARAALVYEAMAYQIAKGIGELATVVAGRVDRIILTGGLAHSELLTGWIRDRVAFIAPVKVLPGENELEALAQGALRVLRGEETAGEYELG